MSNDRQSTHWDGCYAHHLGCAQDHIEDLTAARNGLVTIVQCKDERIAELESEITELRADMEWAIPARHMSPAEIRAARKGE